jgi:glyoxylase-like metal-dependent hydrolase (beta-lactamase superfamily II)
MMRKINRRKFLSLTFLGTASLAANGRNPTAIFEENAIGQEIFHFKIGNFKCINFNTGYHDYAITGFFTGIPADQLQKELGLSTPPEMVRSPYACIFIDTGENRILIDAGIGTFFESPDRLQKLLHHENIPNESIDSIIITHAHPDHYGGLLDDEGNPFFINAHYYSTKDEWDFYTNTEACKKFKEDNASFYERLSVPAIRVYEAIKSNLLYIEPDTEIIPGIKVVDARGHTPGQLAVIVSSSNEKLMYVSDVVFHQLHLKYPDWLPHEGYMTDPVEYIETKRRIFDMAADQHMLVSGMHFYPPPSLGYVERKGNGWEWQPI